MKRTALCLSLLCAALEAAPQMPAPKAAASLAYTAQNFSHLLGMPGFTDQLLTMHFKLYEGYVKNANEVLAALKVLADTGKASSIEFGALKRRLGWEFDGMRLHELYFGNLGGNGAPIQGGQLGQEIAAQYGSFEQWKKEFVATGLMRGIGWVILYRDPKNGRLVNTWIDEHDTGHLATASPILIMDVFEHAYMPQFGLDRAKYIDAFFNNLDWEVAENRFTFSSGPAGPAGK